MLITLPARLNDPAQLIVLVTGGRFFGDARALRAALDQVELLRLKFSPLPAMVIIQGGATGADRIAREWAWDHHKRLITERAEWMKHGKAAGPMRNQAMLDKYHPDMCIAASGGRGTLDMVRRCETAKVPVHWLTGMMVGRLAK